MSFNAARHAREIIRNIEYVIAIEYLCATQAIDLQLGKIGNQTLQMGKGSGAAYRCIRENGINKLKMDRVLYPDLRKAAYLVRSGRLVKVARQAIGQEDCTW